MSAGQTGTNRDIVPSRPAIYGRVIAGRDGTTCYKHVPVCPAPADGYGSHRNLSPPTLAASRSFIRSAAVEFVGEGDQLGGLPAEEIGWGHGLFSLTA